MDRYFSFRLRTNTCYHSARDGYRSGHRDPDRIGDPPGPFHGSSVTVSGRPSVGRRATERVVVCIWRRDLILTTSDLCPSFSYNNLFKYTSRLTYH